MPGSPLRIALAACAAALLLGAPPALAAWPGANGLLAFDTFAPGKEVHTRLPGGRREREVASFEPDFQQSSGTPQWSPDGRRILYHRVPDGIETVRADGRGRRLLRTAYWWPTWSPNGREFLAVDPETTPYSLVRMRTDGSHPRHIRIPGGAGVALPRWSPTGRWIIYDESRPEGEFISRVAPDGSGFKRLIEVAGAQFVWSPDGSRIAYTAGRQVLSMRPDGRGRRLLARGRENTTVVSIAWSPDGSRIVLVRQTPADAHDSSEVAVIPARGGRERRLFGGARWIGPIDWQPR